MDILLTYLMPLNLLWNFIGVAIGIIFGAIPGLTATMGVALFLPFTFGMDVVQSFALLLGIYCGGTYGGSITAILIRTPGSPASAATVLDGYPMAKRGEAGKALNWCITASAVGGIFSCLILCLFSGRLASLALKFGPSEYCAIGVFGLSIVASLSGNNLRKGALMAALGLLVTTIGLDPITGTLRYTFGQTILSGGISFVPVLIGVFAISEVFTCLENQKRPHVEDERIKRVESAKLSPKELKGQVLNMLRSSVIGTIVGIIPATGSGIAGWISYNTAKNADKDPDSYGSGNPGGIVASESANNAVTGGALVPLLTLGIPGDVVTAIMLGALMLQGLTPGPTLFAKNPDVIYGIYTMLVVANIFMYIQGRLGVRLFAKALDVPMKILMPIVFVLCMIGAFAINNRILDMFIALLFGVVGYLLRKVDYPMPPLLLGMVLGGTIEANYRRAMVISQGSLSIFVTRPISLLFLLLAVFMCFYPMIQRRRGAKRAEKDPGQ